VCVYAIIEKYDNNIIVDKVIDGSDIFINGIIVDNFNILDKNCIHTLNVSATHKQLNRFLKRRMYIIRNETNKIWKRYKNIVVRDTGQYIRRIQILK
jgi:hypothetical protein